MLIHALAVDIQGGRDDGGTEQGPDSFDVQTPADRSAIAHFATDRAALEARIPGVARGDFEEKLLTRTENWEGLFDGAPAWD